MKCPYSLVLLALACLIVPAAASATVITSSAGATPTIKAESEGYVVLDREPANIECTSTIEGKVESHGPGVTAVGNINSLSFYGCKDLWHVTVTSPGTLEVHWTTGSNGTVTSSGLTVTATRQGIICNYSTQNTDIGTITGGEPATIHLAASIPRHGGSQFCGGSTAPLTGSYKVASPLSLSIDKTILGPATVTAPQGIVATPAIKAKSEGNITLHNQIAKLGCTSVAEGAVASHGTGPVTGNLSALSFTGCTSGWHVTVTALGSLSLHSTEGSSGTVTSTGLTIEATHFGTVCSYKTENTDLGTFTSGTPATLHLEATIPRHGGSELCGSASAELTGSYAVNSPAALFVDRGAVKGELGTSVTSPKGTVATPAVKSESEGQFVIHNSIVNIECSSTLDAAIEQHGDDQAASGKISALTFTGCKNEWLVEVTAKGRMDVHWISGANGTVVVSGTTISAKRAGLSCNYVIEATDLGTLTGGTPATLDLSGKISLHSGSFLCGASTTAITGNYVVSSPTSLFVDKAPVEDEPGSSITSPTGSVATSVIDAESEGHVGLDHPITDIECQWGVKGVVDSHGPGEPVAVSVSSLTIAPCTDSWHATTVSPGELEIDWAGGSDGTVSWSGGTVEMTRSGTTCRYITDDTHLGTITGGSPATIHLEGTLPFHSGSALCGEEAYPLTGSLKVTSPTSLFVDKAS